MKRTALALGLGTLVAFLGTGCKIVVTGNDTYETCFSTSDCGNATDSCVSIPANGSGSPQSQCTHTCSADTDCEFAGRCLSFDGGRQFYCVESCTSSLTCEAGWDCAVVDAGRNACLPRGATRSNTYETCSSTSDCGNATDSCVSIPANGTGSPQSECTHTCSVDTDCEFAGRCLSFDGGRQFYCVESCTSSTTCEAGWDCSVVDAGRNACLPRGGTAPALQAFDECPFGTTPNPCQTGVECWGVTVDRVMAGLCTRECSSDASCPLDPRGVSGTCLAFPGAPALCYEGCRNAADCAPGWACKTMADGLTFPSICVPM